MTSSQWGRAFASTAWSGLVTGLLVGACWQVLGMDDRWSAEDVVLDAAAGGFYGALIGMVVGVLLGVPVVVAAAVVREQSGAWRLVGTLAAATLGAAAGFVVADATSGVRIGSPSPLPIIALCTFCPAWRAWRGLRWIFEPDRGPLDPVGQRRSA